MKMVKKVITLAAAVGLMFCVSSQSQAATVTFDELPPGTIIDSSTYAAQGIHFAPNPYDNTGVIMAGGTWGITGINGPQFSAWTPTPLIGLPSASASATSGFTVHLDDPVSEFSICIALGADPGVEASFDWMAFNDNGLVGIGTSSFPATAGTWMTFTIDAGDVGGNLINEVSLIYSCSDEMPQVGYDFPAVPLPASLLLLGSGLIPVLARRKR